MDDRQRIERQRLELLLREREKTRPPDYNRRAVGFVLPSSAQQHQQGQHQQQVANRSGRPGPGDVQATYWLRVEWVRLCGVDDDWYRLRITGFNARDKETIQHAAEWTCEACMLPNVRRNSERLLGRHPEALLMAIRQARVIELQADSKYAPIPTNVLLLIEANKTCMTYLLEGVSDFYKHVSGEKSVCPKLEVDTISVFAHTRSQRYFEAEIMRDELMQCMATGRPSRCRTLVFKFDGPFMFGRNSEHDGCVDFTPLTLGKYLVLAWREGCEALSDFDVARVKDVIGATSRPLTLVGLPAKTLQAIMPHVEMREPLVTVVTHRKYSERVGTRAYNHQFNIGTRFGVRLS